MKKKYSNKLNRIQQWLNDHDINQRAGFRLFLCGGIVFITSLGTIILTLSSAEPTLQQLALLTIATMLTVVGVIVGAAGYLSLLVLRLSEFLQKDKSKI